MKDDKLNINFTAAEPKSQIGLIDVLGLFSFSIKLEGTWTF